MKTIETWFYVGLLAVILILGVGMYYEGAISHASPSTSTQSSTNEYNITLVITNQNYEVTLILCVKNQQNTGLLKKIN